MSLRLGLSFLAPKPRIPLRLASGAPWNQYDTDRFAHELTVFGSQYADFDTVNKSIGPERHGRIVEIYNNTAVAPLPLVVIGPSQMVWMPTTLFNFGGVQHTLARGARYQIRPKGLEKRSSRNPNTP